MTKRLVCLVFGILLIVGESSLFSLFSVEISKPDLSVPFVIYAVYFLSPFEGLVVAVVFSLAQEIFSVSPAGSILFSKVSLFLCCMFLKSRLYIESRYIFSLVCAAAVLLQAFVFLALSATAKGETKDIVNVLVQVIPNAILTGFISLFLYSLFEQLQFRYADRF